MAKIQPAVKTLQFTIPGNESGVSLGRYIDLSQVCSKVSRRFYRQGKVWVVAGFKIIASNGFIGSINVQRLPDTWSVSNSWHKCFSNWKKQQDEAIDDSGSQSAVAKYRDFKIHMDPDHVVQGFTSNLIPIDASLNGILPGEWEASQIVIPNIDPDASGSTVDPREFFLHMVGVNNLAVAGPGTGSRGMVSGYAHSRAFPQSPDPVSPAVEDADNWMRDMFDVGGDTTDIVRNATLKNDDLPYDQDEYPGGETNFPGLQTVDIVSMTPQAVLATRQLSGDTFPCGLIKINIDTVTGGSDDDIGVLVHLVPGADRGYLTQPMQDM